MANGSSVVAHLFKLAVTLICMRYLECSYSIFAIESGWAARACFQILLVHSILGVLTFGISGGATGKRIFRSLYDRLSTVIETLPFALLATEISLRCYVNEALRQGLLLALGILPLAHELMRKKDRPATRCLTDAALVLQLSTILVACLRRGRCGVISFAVSYAINRYLLEDLCDRFDVPYIDLAQYSLCFVEIFALVTINEL